MPLLNNKITPAKPVGKLDVENLLGSGDAGVVISALLGPVLVDSPVLFESGGAIERKHALAVLAWLCRDVDKHLGVEALAIISKPGESGLLSKLALKIADLIAKEQMTAHGNPEAIRRIQIQLGGEPVYERLGVVENALRNYQLVEKAVAYGKAINGVTDENSLKLALQTFPMDNPSVSSLMIHAALGQINNPIRLICAVTDLADGETQRAVTRSGFAALVEGLLAHAQNQIPLFAVQNTSFSDIDLICGSLERYHRLIRAISNITQNDKSCSWAQMVAAIVRRMSELIEPWLLRVDSDVRQSLRKPRAGPDSIDASLQLDALNGLYLLAAVREALDALALNSIVNKLWIDVGKVLEVMIERNLDAFRNFPDNEFVARRLDIGIKMAKIRFNPEYAGIITRARNGASRRATG